MAKSKKKPAALKTVTKTVTKTTAKASAKPAKAPLKVKAKPVKALKAEVKAAKPAKAKAEVKPVKAQAVKMASKAVPKTKVEPKAEIKDAKVSNSKAAVKKEEPKKAKPVAPLATDLAKKVIKDDKKDDKKLAKVEKIDKDAKNKAKKKDGEEEDFEPEEFEELEVAETYGDAIRLTSQDLEDPEEMFLTDADGRRYCKVKDCDQLAVVEGFCRFHYLSLWKKIQTRKKILIDGKLEKYIEELTSRYPDKYLEMIKRDLKTEKDFLAAIQELEIDDSAEGDMEEDSGFIDEVRGMAGRGRSGDESSGGGSDESF